MLEMRLEGLAKYPNDFEPPVVVLRAIDGERRLCLGVCEEHARAAADLIRSGGVTAAPSCRASRRSRRNRVVGAYLTWQTEGPMGPQVGFKLLFERAGRSVAEPSCLFGVLKSALKWDLGVRVEEQVLAELGPSDGEPRWLARPTALAVRGPVKQFIESLEEIDQL